MNIACPITFDTVYRNIKNGCTYYVCSQIGHDCTGPDEPRFMVLYRAASDPKIYTMLAKSFAHRFEPCNKSINIDSMLPFTSAYKNLKNGKTYLSYAHIVEDHTVWHEPRLMRLYREINECKFWLRDAEEFIEKFVITELLGGT